MYIIIFVKLVETYVRKDTRDVYTFLVSLWSLCVLPLDLGLWSTCWTSSSVGGTGFRFSPEVIVWGFLWRNGGEHFTNSHGGRNNWDPIWFGKSAWNCKFTASIFACSLIYLILSVELLYQLLSCILYLHSKSVDYCHNKSHSLFYWSQRKVWSGSPFLVYSIQ